MKNPFDRMPGAATVTIAAAALSLPASIILGPPPSVAGTAEAIPCLRLAALCAWNGTDGQGTLHLLFRTQTPLPAPVHSAKNQTDSTWCLYSKPSFQGRHHQISPGATVRDLGFGARSVRREPC